MVVARSALGLPLEGGSLDGLMLPFFAWLILIILTFPALLAVFIPLVAIVVCAPMSATSALTIDELTNLVFRGEYPNGWFEQSE